MKKNAIIAISVLLTMTLLLASFFVVRAKIYPIKYVEEINLYSAQFNLSPTLVASVINTESSFNKNAYSTKGAIGLMQIKLSTAQYMIDYYNLDIELAKNDLFEIDNNLYFGCMYLSYLNKKFNNIDTSLASYNAGETIVRAWLKNEQYSCDGKTLDIIPYTETKNYINRVNKNIKFYKNIFKN